VGRASVFYVDVSPCPVPSAILSHPLPHSDCLPRYGRQDFASAMGTDDICSTTVPPATNTDIVGSVFTKLCHIFLLSDKLPHIEVKVRNSVVRDIVVRSLLSWPSSLRNCFLVIFQCPC
jgi:hypothetical protein